MEARELDRSFAKSFRSFVDSELGWMRIWFNCLILPDFSPQEEDVFQLKVTVDITSKTPITKQELNRIFEESIDHESSIGGLKTTKDDVYKLVVVEGKWRAMR